MSSTGRSLLDIAEGARNGANNNDRTSPYSRQDTGTSSDDFQDARDTLHDSNSNSHHADTLEPSNHHGDYKLRRSTGTGTPPPPALAPVTPSSEVSTNDRESKRGEPMATNAAASDMIEPRRLDPELAGLEKDHEDNTDTAGHEATNDGSKEVPEQPQHQSSTEEIDLLIEQLDQIETEYSAKLAASQATLHEKDAIVGALGHNLSELKYDNSALRNELKQEKDSVQLLQDELVRTNGKLADTREEMEQLRKEHKVILRQEVQRLEAKATKVEKDVCHAAEEQFAQAKRAYESLLRERDEVLLERDAMARELQATREESAEMEMRSKANEADLLARIAELKAEIASSKAETVSVKRDCKGELVEAQSRIRSLEEALRGSNEERTAARHGLASAQTKTETLEKENAELNALCEELMGIVEGRGGEETITSTTTTCSSSDGQAGGKEGYQEEY